MDKPLNVEIDVFVCGVLHPPKVSKDATLSERQVSTYSAQHQIKATQ